MCTATFCWPAMKINFRTDDHGLLGDATAHLVCVFKTDPRSSRLLGSMGLECHSTELLRGKKYQLRLGRV